jgi:hypothetical protein
MATPLRARCALGSRHSAGLAGEARVRACAPARPLRLAAARAVCAAAEIEPLMVRALRGEKVRGRDSSCMPQQLARERTVAHAGNAPAPRHSGA